MFDLAYEISRATPAAYNPRQIDEASIAGLRDSLRTLGLIRPIIVTDTGTILAGHQRTKAMSAEGFTTCPAHVLHDIGTVDEVRFNQLHNASDQELNDADVTVPPQSGGWGIVPAKEIQIGKKSRAASKINEILRLLTLHGEFSSAIVAPDGRVIVGQLYAIACRTVGIPLRVFTVTAAQVPDKIEASLSREFNLPWPAGKSVGRAEEILAAYRQAINAGAS